MSSPTATTNPAYPDRMSDTPMDPATIDELTADTMAAVRILTDAGYPAGVAVQMVAAATLEGMHPVRYAQMVAGQR